MVTRLDRLSSALLTPALTGEGNTLYPLATGLKIILSKPMLTANVTLLSGSKQSFTGFDFLESSSSPSAPAKALVNTKKVIIKIVKFFFIIDKNI